MTRWMNESINNEAVCRTAPATPGLLTRQVSPIGNIPFPYQLHLSLTTNHIFNARQQFGGMFSWQPFAGNHSHKQRFAGSLWLCKCQEARMRLTSCQSSVKYMETWHSSSMVWLMMIILSSSYFSDVLARKDQLDKEGETLLVGTHQLLSQFCPQ